MSDHPRVDQSALVEFTPPVQITLRDYFAAKAMQALITNDKFTVGMGEPPKQTQAADKAYSFADAMLRKRNAK